MGETRAGSMVGGVVVVTDEQSGVVGNRAVAASTGDFIAVPTVVKEGEEEC